MDPANLEINEEDDLYGKYIFDENNALFGKSVPDFYDFEAGKLSPYHGCRRKMIIEQDNAPYNHGVECNLASYSREKCAQLLRDLGVPRIIFDHTLEDGMVVTHNIEVPTVANTPWQKIGKLPTAYDIKVATKKIILEKLPNLLRPGYKKLCDEFDDIKVTSTAEYTSPW